MCKNHNQNQYPVSTPREVFIKITEIEAKAAKALVSYHPKLAAHMIKTSQYQVCHTEQEPAICHEEQKEKTVGFVRGAVIVNYSTMMINWSSYYDWHLINVTFLFSLFLILWWWSGEVLQASGGSFQPQGLQPGSSPSLPPGNLPFSLPYIAIFSSSLFAICNMLSYLADRYPFSSFIPALWNRSPTRAVARFHPQYQSRCLARWTCNSHMFNVHIFCAHLHLHFTPSFAGLSVSPLVHTPDDLSNIVLSLYMYCLHPSTNIHLAIQTFLWVCILIHWYFERWYFEPLPSLYKYTSGHPNVPLSVFSFCFDQFNWCLWISSRCKSGSGQDIVIDQDSIKEGGW